MSLRVSKKPNSLKRTTCDKIHTCRFSRRGSRREALLNFCRVWTKRIQFSASSRVTSRSIATPDSLLLRYTSDSATACLLCLPACFLLPLRALRRRITRDDLQSITFDETETIGPFLAPFGYNSRQFFDLLRIPSHIPFPHVTIYRTYFPFISSTSGATAIILEPTARGV